MQKGKCINCENELKRNAKKYCSLQCQQDYYWTERKKAFLKTGFWDSYNGRAQKDAPLGKNYKRFLREKRGHQCEQCGRKGWNKKPIPLVLDHIDGNSTNWELTNLRLLCCNCDAQTDTYKGKNKGNGRHWRRQRYKEGKSY